MDLLTLIELFCAPVTVHCAQAPAQEASLYSTEAGAPPTEGLTFLGLISLVDPPRDGVGVAVAKCRCHAPTQQRQDGACAQKNWHNTLSCTCCLVDTHHSVQGICRCHGSPVSYVQDI